jgi:hypothetical protein
MAVNRVRLVSLASGGGISDVVHKINCEFQITNYPLIVVRLF